VSLLLALAVAAPLAGSVAAVLVPERAARAVRIGALASAAAWFVLLVDGTRVSVSGIHSTPLVAAAGCGAALVAAALNARTVERPAVAGMVLAAASISVAAGRTATDGGGAVLALAAAIAFAAVAGRSSVRVWGTAGAGVVTAAVGVVALRSAANSWQLPLAEAATSHRGPGVLIVVGAALVVFAGAQRPRQPATVVVPAAAFLAAQAAPIVHRTDGLPWLAVLLGAAAVASAVAAHVGKSVLYRPAAALTLLGLAALVAPGAARGSGLLLAAAGVLAAAIGYPAAAVLGVPGGIALAIALAARGGGAAFIVGVLVGAVALALAVAVHAVPLPRIRWWMAPTLALGGWLLIAPGTWGWVGSVNLRAFDVGAARAVAGAALCILLLVLLGRDPARWYARANPPDSPGEDAVRH
jgi:hypothetical protein